MKMQTLALGVTLLTAMSGCALSAQNDGVQGRAAVSKPDVKGTVFTIVFENKEKGEVIKPEVETFWNLSRDYSRAEAYISNAHPSLVNYIVMTSGDRQGIGSNDPPAKVATDEPLNLGEQLDAHGIKWRAYLEDMGEPCKLESSGDYAVHHNPWVYYTTLTDDVERCKDRVVDFEEHFEEDLAKDEYKYMWITPNQCNNMHNCDASVGDAWLKDVVTKIQASPGYQNGGAIFILFDEGSTRILDAEANLPTVIVSEQLVKKGYVSETRFDHAGYLATVQDIFQMPRFPSTYGATPLSEFFKERTDTPTK
ncbi:MAG: hypothetical protein IPK82_08670 [Polyangiaceae bacterium]|nr:hypothetical protein [Polyangiaceae bacterium]